MKASDRPHLSLARVPLFTGLDDATRDDIFSCMHSRHYAAGELICRQGDPSDSLFLLRSGVAHAFLTSLTGSSVTTIARLRPGDVIGEVGVVTNLPRSASVVARSDAVVLELAREDVATLLTRHPRLLANITQVIGGRLAKMNADLRRHRTGEVIAVVVGVRFARAATKAIAAARLASAQPFAAVDLLSKRVDGMEEGTSRIQAGTPASIVQAIERFDELSATHATVAIAATPQEEEIALLLEHADRVVAVLADDEAVTLAAMLRDTSQDADLILVSEEMGFPRIPSDGYRVVRRCHGDLTGADVAWLGRHLSRTKLGLHSVRGVPSASPTPALSRHFKALVTPLIMWPAAVWARWLESGWRSVGRVLRSMRCCVSNAEQKPLSIRFFARERREMDWRCLRGFFERPQPIAPSLISRFLPPL